MKLIFKKKYYSIYVLNVLPKVFPECKIQKDSALPLVSTYGRMVMIFKGEE